ncbi:hypothetical protein [Pseudoalteromonas phage vB_PtuP_Slicky01]|nr:hypothetical protein [Pseudoalteromonas phage vB_PtuP_Slicky01]
MMHVSLDEDTLYDIFNDRTLMEMIPDEETEIELTSDELIASDSPWFSDEGGE